MKAVKYIFLFFVVCLLTACGALGTIQRSCKTEISKTAKGNFIFCAICDSLTFNKIFNHDTTTNR